MLPIQNISGLKYLARYNCDTVVWKDKLDLRIVQGIWLGPWSKVSIEHLEFIENLKKLTMALRVSS